MIHPSAVVHPNVRLGRDVVVGEFVIIGAPPRDCEPGALATRIGEGSIIRSHTVIYAGNRIGRRFQTGHGVLVREACRIGDDVSIGSHSAIEHHVTIGDAVRIHSQVFVPEHTRLDDGCWLGPRAVLTNARYPRSHKVKERLQSPVIRKQAKVGANATLLPGVVIGERALVGAGAVVVASVPPGKIVAGNPARILRDIATVPAYRLPA